MAGRNAEDRLEVFVLSAMDGQPYNRWQTSSGDSTKWINGRIQIYSAAWAIKARTAVAQNADGRLEFMWWAWRIKSITGGSKQQILLINGFPRIGLCRNAMDHQQLHPLTQQEHHHHILSILLILPLA